MVSAQTGSSSAVFFANAKARQAKALFEQSIAAFKEVGVEIQDAGMFEDMRLLHAKVQEAVKNQVPLVILGGGDGTLSAMVRHLVGKPSCLGVVPFGTGNAFARDLTLPFNIADACKVIADGNERKIDLGYAGSDYFVNVVTAGLSERIVTELTDQVKQRFGRAAYIFAMGRALAKIRGFRARLITEEQTLEFETLQVVIGNGRYHAGPFPLAPDASITEGKLSVYALATTHRAAFLKLAWKLRTGRQCELPEVYSISTVGGRLETTPSHKVVIDGEIVYRTPINFKVVPGAISVRVPSGFNG